MHNNFNKQHIDRIDIFLWNQTYNITRRCIYRWNIFHRRIKNILRMKLFNIDESIKIDEKPNNI